MSDLKTIGLFEAPDDLFEEEGQATLDAIDAGIRASDEGRVVPLEQVRKLIPQWISKYALQNRRSAGDVRTFCPGPIVSGDNTG